MSKAIYCYFLCFLMVGFSGCGESPSRSREGYVQVVGSPSMIVAKVGDHKISRRDLAREVNAQAGPILARGDNPPPNFEETMLQIMIKSELLYQLGKDDFSGPAEEKAAKKYKETLAAFASEAALAEALARDGLTLEEYRDNLKRKYIVDFFLDREVHSKLKFSQQQVEKYYQDHLSQFSGPDGQPRPLPQVQGQIEMLLSAPFTPGMVEELVAQAREKIPVEVFYSSDAKN